PPDPPVPPPRHHRRPQRMGVHPPRRQHPQALPAPQRRRDRLNDPPGRTHPKPHTPPKATRLHVPARGDRRQPHTAQASAPTTPTPQPRTTTNTNPARPSPATFCDSLVCGAFTTTPSSFLASATQRRDSPLTPQVCGRRR